VEYLKGLASGGAALALPSRPHNERKRHGDLPHPLQIYRAWRAVENIEQILKTINEIKKSKPAGQGRPRGFAKRIFLPRRANQADAISPTAPVRFAILAIVAREHPVARWTADHVSPARSIAAMPALRSTFSGRPRYRPAALLLAIPSACRRRLRPRRP